MIFYTQCQHMFNGSSRARGILQCKADDAETAALRLTHLAYLSGFKAMRRGDNDQLYYVQPTPSDMHVQRVRDV